MNPLSLSNVLSRVAGSTLFLAASPLLVCIAAGFYGAAAVDGYFAKKELA